MFILLQDVSFVLVRPALVAALYVLCTKVHRRERSRTTRILAYRGKPPICAPWKEHLRYPAGGESRSASARDSPGLLRETGYCKLGAEAVAGAGPIPALLKRKVPDKTANCAN